MGIPYPYPTHGHPYVQPSIVEQPLPRTNGSPTLFFTLAVHTVLRYWNHVFNYNDKRWVKFQKTGKIFSIYSHLGLNIFLHFSLAITHLSFYSLGFPWQSSDNRTIAFNQRNFNAGHRKKWRTRQIEIMLYLDCGNN